MSVSRLVIIILVAGALFELGSLLVATRKPAKRFEYYAGRLDAWVKDGGSITEVQDRVVRNCGKLVISQAGMAGAVRLVTVGRRDFEYRVDVCTKMTINRLYKQPMFQNMALLKTLCNGTDIFFRRLCARSGLAPE